MKKLKKIGLNALVAVAFSAALIVNLGSGIGVSAARADDPGTGTGTGTEEPKGIWAPVVRNVVNDDNEIVKVVTCCGNGTDKDCTPVDC
jgi:hypothetical protein